jgi:hypothetical protein
MKQHLTQLGLALCAAAFGAAGSAHASQAGGAPAAAESLALFGGAHDVAHDGSLNTAPAAVKVQLVDDDVLADQTGKYAGATMISGFVLNVLSQWQLPNGVSALAEGTLSAVRNTAGQLVSSISTQASVTGNGHGDSGANPNAQTIGGQSIGVNGVSQVTQVAGDSNIGSNAATIDFSNAAVAATGTANAASAIASNASGSVTAGISFGSAGVKVALQTPAGLATQTIAPGNGQIAQLLQIAGNNQQVVNALQLHLQTQQMSATMLRQMGVLQALQNRR